MVAWAKVDVALGVIFSIGVLGGGGSGYFLFGVGPGMGSITNR